ncbi:MAG: DUF2244 domain-containing protein [Proteobacteria bacterium]|nr:DUF2244 domain-containing protein [Pseudomonadota bacterium]
MAASIAPSSSRAQAASPVRFGHELASGNGSVDWMLKRNCSMAPRQLLAVYLSLCIVACAIGAVCWLAGAPYVLPFAWIELLAVGAALLIYARHAGDREDIHLEPGRLTVACASGSRIDRAEFVPDWVRVEPAGDDGSLIELSGQGRRIAVGRYLRPELRSVLADELRWALRRGPCGAAA